MYIYETRFFEPVFVGVVRILVFFYFKFVLTLSFDVQQDDRTNQDNTAYG